MTHTLAAAAALLLTYAAFHQRLDRALVSAALFFTAAGFLLGSVLDVIHLQVGSELVKRLAEATLVLVLFTDASRISVKALRSEAAIPGRLLGIGLPLTILAGVGVALVLIPSLTLVEGLLLAVMLSCTDAALGKAVVTDERVPSRIRQGLNVESGLNDGICVPIFLIALTVAEAEDGAFGHGEAFRVVAEQLGFGLVAGVVAGVLGVLALRYAKPPHSSAWGQILAVSVAALSAGLAHSWGGSIFIAAFTAGIVTAALPTPDASIEDHTHFLEQAGEIFNAITFVVFGTVILEPALREATWAMVGYALLSLTLVRLVPVALALAGTGATRTTVAFVGWFGPRGLATVVFGVMLLDDADLVHEQTILATAALTVGLSVLLHGVSAAPLTSRYVRSLAAADADADERGPEHGEVHVPRWRTVRPPEPERPPVT